MSNYDYLIVGSGLFGATFAYRAKQAGKRCLVIEKRSHLGGNVFCENIDGINVHKYGAHVFHTSNKEVWDFVNRFVVFNRYTNSPLANYKGRLYNLPFSMNTFNQLWNVSTPEEAMVKLDSQRKDAIAQLKGKEPQNLEQQALVLVGKDIYETFIKEYTEKQWGRSCADLPAFIIRRLSVRLTFDNNYFDDLYQGVPIGGYNNLIEGLLEGIDCITNCDFFHNDIEFLNDSWIVHNNSCLRDHWQSFANNLVYTGPLDEYFDYKLGHLDWRTVSFKTRIKNIPNFQGNAVVNYTSHNQPYTRIIEHKHFEMFGNQVYDSSKTVISEEYSVEYSNGLEPYYPINDVQNTQLADKYRYLADQEKNIIFGGRLAEYRYYNMDQVILRALQTKIEDK